MFSSSSIGFFFSYSQASVQTEPVWLMYEELINEGGAQSMRERWGSRRLRWKATQRVMTQKGKIALWTKDSVDPDVCSSLLTLLTLNQGSASPSEASVRLIRFGAGGNIFTRSDLHANFLVWTRVCQSPAPGTKWLHISSVMFERNKNAYKREIQKIYLQRAKGDKPAARASRVCCCRHWEMGQQLDKKHLGSAHSSN